MVGMYEILVFIVLIMRVKSLQKANSAFAADFEGCSLTSDSTPSCRKPIFMLSMQERAAQPIITSDPSSIPTTIPLLQ
jgi:hypothetical protein